jgi:putative membrane-bound dehydrogenase-like protein
MSHGLLDWIESMNQRSTVHRFCMHGMAALVCLLMIMDVAHSQDAVTVKGKTEKNVASGLAGVRVTLLAEQPDLVTPTGIDVDRDGNVWLVACHTHFRPANYQGPVKDEVLVFDSNGKNRRLFYNQTTATMQLKLGADGWVYLAQRDRILRVRDSNGDGLGDQEESVAVLETSADYPHNGLSGMAWMPDGSFLFALGENFSKQWKLTGSDGAYVEGRGEGGIFQCTPDGKELKRIAVGFWNPFGLLVRADGEIFAAENDPGSRPPCRLLNIVPGADYGFQRIYGESAIHPFVAWNGELRGTLGMVHPSGEAPCAVVELGGGVLIPSWSSHRIDYFPLHRDGAGYKSERIELVSGPDTFRPVCMTSGREGTYYFADWVSPSYELHGLGRLWKLEVDLEAPWIQKQIAPANAEAVLAKQLRDGTKKLSPNELFDLAAGEDSYLSDAALTALARVGKGWSVEQVQALPANQQLWALVALRRVDLKETKWVKSFLNVPDREIVFECLRWIADGVLTEFSEDVEKLLVKSDIDYRTFEAALATHNTLRGKAELGVTDIDVLLQRLLDPATPPAIQGYCLRLIPASHEKLTAEYLGKLLVSDHEDLRKEVVRTLSLRNTPDAWALLSQVASNEREVNAIRGDAIAGLSRTNDSRYVDLLLKLAAQKDQVLKKEAFRALRRQPNITEHPDLLSRLKDDQVPETEAVVAILEDPQSVEKRRPSIENPQGWVEYLEKLPGTPDVESGRRVFFHGGLASCSDCHRWDGRGNVVGPELSMVSRQGDTASILHSLLEPNRDVAPQFFASAIELEDGTTFTGILLRSSNTEVFRDSQGKERSFPKKDIVERKELKSSLMPIELWKHLTDNEIRDLLAFLNSNRP